MLRWEGGKVVVEPPGRSQAASGNMTPACRLPPSYVHSTPQHLGFFVFFPSKNVTNMKSFAFLLWPFWEKTFILSQKEDETLEQKVVASGRRYANPLFSYLCRCSADFESWIWSKDVPLLGRHLIFRPRVSSRQGPHLSIRIGIWILPSDLVMTWTVFVLTIQIERRQCYLVHTTQTASKYLIIKFWPGEFLHRIFRRERRGRQRWILIYFWLKDKSYPNQTKDN